MSNPVALSQRRRPSLGDIPWLASAPAFGSWARDAGVAFFFREGCAGGAANGSAVERHLPIASSTLTVSDGVERRQSGFGTDLGLSWPREMM